MARKSTSFDETLFKILKKPEEAAAYLNEHLEYRGKDRDALFLKALRQVALAQGMQRISVKTRLPRRSIEKALSENGNPRFSTFSSLLDALGLNVAIQSKQKKAS
jgi:probable addiction module antidote protein